jgi:signal transduction histidine kinase
MPKEVPTIGVGNVSRNTRLLLLVGFGGLLLLMAFGGITGLRVLQTIQKRNDAIRQDFLARNRLLNQIRSDLYLSATYVRDYLLEPENAKAESQRTSLDRIRLDMETALQEYGALLGRSEINPLRNLQEQLREYWRVLQPAMYWSPEQRRQSGYAFLRDEVYSRRAVMLSLADQIGAVNEQQLDSRNAQVGQLFSGFRVRLLITLLVVLCLGVLLAAFSITRILRLENESSQRYQEIEQARSELKELSARLVVAQEDERKAISRELHDEVGQTLSAMLVGLGNLAADLPPAVAAQAARHLASIRSLAEASVRSVRNITLLLRPSMLDDLGLLPALQWQARELSKRSGLVVDVAADGVPEDLSDQYKTSIYRVVQEALHNCEQHAHAKHLRVTVRRQEDSLVLSIQDDGRGFQPETERGMGLLGIEERINNLGGTLTIDSELGNGTLIMARLPFPEPVQVKAGTTL